MPYFLLVGRDSVERRVTGLMPTDVLLVIPSRADGEGPHSCNARQLAPYSAELIDDAFRYKKTSE